MYIQLSNFPQHYLVLVITDDEFRYALISASVVPDSMYGNMVMEDIAWLDLERIHGQNNVVVARTNPIDSGLKRKGGEISGVGELGRRVFNPGRCVIVKVVWSLTYEQRPASIWRLRSCENFMRTAGKIVLPTQTYLNDDCLTFPVLASRTQKWNNSSSCVGFSTRMLTHRAGNPCRLSLCIFNHPLHTLFLPCVCKRHTSCLVHLLRRLQCPTFVSFP